MLPVGVLLVFVLTLAPAVSSRGSHHHGVWKPFTPRPPHKPTKEQCCGFYCATGHHCKVQETCGEAACFPDNPCPSLECSADEQCVVPPTGQAYCQTRDPCSTEICRDGSSCEVVGGEAKCFSGCRYESRDYKQGEVAVDTTTDECYNLQCSDGVMKPFVDVTKGNACQSPFDDYLSGAGCYYLVQQATNWCDARKQCQALGGDLAFESFNTLKGYLDSKYGGSNYNTWIGVRDNVWLSGRTVADPEEWGPGEPGEQTQCSRMRDNGVWDNVCHTSYHFVCQLF